MSDLRNVSQEELQAELDRRKVPAVTKPEPLAVPDFSALITMMADGIERSIADGFENEDFKYYIYEAAMEAVYGGGCWIWRSAQKW